MNYNIRIPYVFFYYAIISFIYLEIHETSIFEKGRGQAP